MRYKLADATPRCPNAQLPRYPDAQTPFCAVISTRVKALGGRAFYAHLLWHKNPLTPHLLA